MEIIEAITAEQIEVSAQLFREYQTQLNVDLCFQGFEQELATLPGKYASPTGAILLAIHEGDTIGCVAVRPIEGDSCEMKRLYVRDQYRGLSAGRKLTEAIIDKARALGYKKMQLDTLQRLDRAISLYAKLGFVETKPYYDNPLNEVVYWELLL